MRRNKSLPRWQESETIHAQKKTPVRSHVRRRKIRSRRMRCVVLRSPIPTMLLASGIGDPNSDAVSTNGDRCGSYHRTNELDELRRQACFSKSPGLRIQWFDGRCLPPIANPDEVQEESQPANWYQTKMVGIAGSTRQNRRWIVTTHPRGVKRYFRGLLSKRIAPASSGGHTQSIRTCKRCTTNTNHREKELVCRLHKLAIGFSFPEP